MVSGGLTLEDGVESYRIDGVEGMAPFLTTVVSDTDLWMFVSSTGALTAGRVDADHALLPYETDDRLHRAAGVSGPVTVIARTVDGERQLWRPFGREVTPGCRRSIAKSVLGDRLVFEEHHQEWSVTFHATWAPSDLHGWVRTVRLADHGGPAADYDVVDGLLDVMPAGVDAHTEQTRSNLVDAYKRAETGPWGTLAVYSLETLITDRPEPAEALTATVVWSAGFAGAEVDLDGRAVLDMVAARPRAASTLLTGTESAYLLRGRVTVPTHGSVGWTIVADIGLDHAQADAAASAAAAPDAIDRVEADVAHGSDRLRALLHGADAFQATADEVADAHHLSNVLFNSMRGGVFPYDHRVPVADFEDFVAVRDRAAHERRPDWFSGLGPWIDVADLRTAALEDGDPHLVRLVLEYLPLTFSRRHGDPSRPWNRFSINVRGPDGGRLLAYEGNWRDIFQNWEALLHSYPEYFANVVAKFVNASTVDGYNPYRISNAGVDWEIPDPDDPWSHIGYWGDHQIVYLLRLLEAWEQYQPDALLAWLERPVFVYADVPYAIADHDAIVRDPRDTITYDEARAADIAARERRVGTDGRLLVDAGGALVRVGLVEKLLVPMLAKLTNYVPGGGIWLNTQRPEWNDANNALAGPGLSMVTLCHLRRYVEFVDGLFERSGLRTASVSGSVAGWLAGVVAVFEDLPDGAIDDRRRRAVLDALGRCGAAHRERARSGHAFEPVDVPVDDVRRLCRAAATHLDRELRSARRADGLYDSYNRVSFPTADTARVDHLGQMLEGQVAALSSGTLDSQQALAVVEALYASEMYRPDQDSLLLYPPIERPPFLSRNTLPAEAARRVRAIASPADWQKAVFVEDAAGRLHFHPDIVNRAVLERRLTDAQLTAADRATVRDVHELVFDHDSFTGRSGSMYAYEGIGSIYWHMVAKLLVAVQEAYWVAFDRGEDAATVARLAAAYRRVRAGLGFNKDPRSYGAFPTDCYSHTPAHAGAQQPGMTGQVKEEVLARFGELGFRVIRGQARLEPGLLAPGEVFPHDADGTLRSATFTVAGVPMTLTAGAEDSVGVRRADLTTEHHGSLVMPAVATGELFARTGSIVGVDWTIGSSRLDRWRQVAT